MTDHEDELARRFRRLFNKDPISHGHKEPQWKIERQDNYEFDDEEVVFSLFLSSILIEQLGKLIEESATLDESDVPELLGLSNAAVKDGAAAKHEAENLLKEGKSVTEQLKAGETNQNDVSEEEVAALLKRLEDSTGKTPFGLSETPQDRSQSQGIEKPAEECPDEAADVAAILAQLTDEAKVDQDFEESESESGLPCLPSVPKDTGSIGEDELSTRLANLKSGGPKNYTGTDRGSINVFVPSVAKTDDDETEHWCGSPITVVI